MRQARWDDLFNNEQLQQVATRTGISVAQLQQSLWHFAAGTRVRSANAEIYQVTVDRHLIYVIMQNHCLVDVNMSA